MKSTQSAAETNRRYFYRAAKIGIVNGLRGTKDTRTCVNQYLLGMQLGLTRRFGSASPPPLHSLTARCQPQACAVNAIAAAWSSSGLLARNTLRSRTSIG
jgi:hypothetical protein